MDIENIVFDLNGTVATDGRIPIEVKEKIQALSQRVNIYVLTADTQGTAEEETPGMNVELIKLSEQDSKRAREMECWLFTAA